MIVIQGAKAIRFDRVTTRAPNLPTLQVNKTNNLGTGATTMEGDGSFQLGGANARRTRPDEDVASSASRVKRAER